MGQLKKIQISKWVVGRLFMLIVLSNSTANAEFTPVQKEFLQNVRVTSLQTMQKSMDEVRSLRDCFIEPRLCRSDIIADRDKIRLGLRQKNEEYRILLGLGLGSDHLRMLPYATVGIGFPNVVFQQNSTSREWRDIVSIESKDRIEIERLFQYLKKEPNYPHVIKSQINQAKTFYRNQAQLLIYQLPVLAFIQSENPSDNDLAKAFGAYLERLNQTFKNVYDETKTPLESFMLYTPIVENLIKENSNYKQVFKSIEYKQKALVGVRAWIERNQPSIIMFGFMTCSMVSAMLQVWPVSIGCMVGSGSLATNNFIKDYRNLEDEFALWLTGVQSNENLATRQARLIYSSLNMLLLGQMAGSTIIGIETSLVTALSSIPSTVASKVGSLTALREGTLEFAKSFATFRAKDLNNSVVASLHDDGETQVTVQHGVIGTNRIYTYSDLAKVRWASQQLALTK